MFLISAALGWFSISSTVMSCHQLLTTVGGWWQLIWKKNYWNFNAHTIFDTCAKFPLSKLILIFINCYQLLTAVDNLWQLIWKKLTGIFMYTLELKFVPNFGSLGWFSFSSTVISCHQLLTADDGRYEKKVKGIFLYIPKLILVLNSSSLEWFSFSSGVNSCYQLLRADDSCYEKKINGIFIYSLKQIPVPNLSFVPGSGAWLESVTLVTNEWQGPCQAILGLLRHSWAGACAWVEQ